MSVCFLQFDRITPHMQHLYQAIENIPLPGLFPVLLLLLVGVLLWCCGRSLLRQGLISVGLIGGFLLGWTLANIFSIPPAPWVIGLVTGILGAFLFTAAFRFAVAFGLSTLLALVAPLLVLTVETAEATGAPALDTGREIVHDLSEIITPDTTTDTATGTLPLPAGTPIAALLNHGTRLASGVRGWWEQVPDPSKPHMGIAAFCGAALGFVLGTLATGFSVTLLTAFGGGFLWLFSLCILLTAAGEPFSRILPAGQYPLLLLWIAIGFLGMVIQWMIVRRKTDRKR